jgi:hypothetical protein
MPLRWLVLALATLPLTAQVTAVPGTGCGSPTTAVQNPPTLGQTLHIGNPVPCYVGTAVVAVGPPATLPWIGCGGFSCPIGLQPFGIVAGPAFATIVLPIPNQPALVGACFRAQSGCLFAACLQPHVAVQICVQ